MTKITPIAIALALIINDFTILYSENFLQSKYLASHLVFLVSMTLLLRELKFFPSSFWRRFKPICLLLEIPISLVVLEVSILYIWKFFQDYVLFHSDAFLVYMSDIGLEWLICLLCCGKSNCSVVIADIILKLWSFVIMIGVCLAIRDL